MPRHKVRIILSFWLFGLSNDAVYFIIDRLPFFSLRFSLLPFFSVRFESETLICREMSTLELDSLSPAETVEIENGLSLVPRLRLNITVYPSSQVVSKPIDEWKMKQTLIEFLKNSLSDPITVPEEDLKIKRVRDLKKRKRDDPVASGTIFIRDLGFLNRTSKNDEDKEKSVQELEKKFSDWTRYIVEKMDGIELNLEGVKFKLNVAVPESDDFEGMKKGWEEFYAFGNRGL